MKSQEDSSFPTDGHKAIRNKLNSNHNRSIALERSVSNKLLKAGMGGGGGGEERGGLKPVLRCSNLATGSVVVDKHIEVVRSV